VGRLIGVVAGQRQQAQTVAADVPGVYTRNELAACGGVPSVQDVVTSAGDNPFLL
jgi:hypothetical protein